MLYIPPRSQREKSEKLSTYTPLSNTKFLAQNTGNLYNLFRKTLDTFLWYFWYLDRLLLYGLCGWQFEFSILFLRLWKYENHFSETRCNIYIYLLILLMHIRGFKLFMKHISIMWYKIPYFSCCSKHIDLLESKYFYFQII